MRDGQIVLVADGAVPRVGWVQAVKPGRPARVHVRGPGGEAVVVRLEPRELVGELSACVASLDQAETEVARLQLRTTHDDLELAWTLLADRPVGIGELAEVLFGRDDPPHRDAATVVGALNHPGFALERGRLIRRDAAARREAEADLQRRAAFAGDIARWRQVLHQHRQGLRVDVADLPERLRAFVTGQSDGALAMWLTQDGRFKRGDVRDAADVLNELRIWDGHEDLELWQSGVLAPWPEDAAASLRSTPDLPPNTPQLDLPFIAMDNDAPHEVDDACCLEPLDGGAVRLHVAIAHPSAWIEPGSAADLEARRRGATMYHPRHVVGMLPDQLARVDASLQVGNWRPALVVSLTLTAAGDMRDPVLQEAWVRVQHAWSYSAIERTVQGEQVPGVDRAVLDALLAAGRRAEEARIRGGAWLLYRPDCEVSAPPFQPVTIRNVQQTSPGRRLVTEVMVQACAAVGQIAAQHQIALPFRTQGRPLQPPVPPGLYEDPAQCLAMFRVLEAGTMQVTPAPHGMMGVPAYVQFTSPLRRYGDILAHRQLVAWLRGVAPPHAPAEMTQLAQSADETAKSMRQWQRKGAYYFKLLWLAGRVQGPPLEGEIVRVLASGERLVFIPALAMDAAVRAPRAGVGESVRLRVVGVHPSRGQLELAAVAA